MAISEDQLLSATLQASGTSEQFVKWTPAVNSNFLPETPQQLLSSVKNRISIPTLRGYTTEDGSYWTKLRDHDNNGMTKEEFNIYVAAVVAEMHQEYSGKQSLVDAVANKYLKVF